MNIQNSLELVSSSFMIAGIFLKFLKNNVSIGTANESTNNPIIIFIAFPASVNACTDVSPNIPVRVKNVEYSTNTKLSIANK